MEKLLVQVLDLVDGSGEIGNPGGQVFEIFWDKSASTVGMVAWKNITRLCQKYGSFLTGAAD